MSTTSRVADHTSDAVNEQIYERTRARVKYYVDHPTEIESRLLELDAEWDTERALETNSSLFSLFGLAMGFAVDRRWFLLPLAIQTFFLQHAVQGWCPPLPLLRRLGVRTTEEINIERMALKAIRGDFEKLTVYEDETSKHSATTVLQAASN